MIVMQQLPLFISDWFKCYVAGNCCCASTAHRACAALHIMPAMHLQQHPGMSAAGSALEISLAHEQQ